MPEKKRKIGVDLAKGKSKTVIVVCQKRRSGVGFEKLFDVKKDMAWVRRRIADDLQIPVELLDPPTKLCDHPAFDNGATIKRLSAHGTIPKKPTE